MDRRTRYSRALVRRALSRPMLRGTARPDGRVGLLTVNYRTAADIARLVASFHRFVRPAGQVVVVANTPLPRKPVSSRVVGLGVNLHHGLGLDFGLAFVRTEYVLVCDPDSVIAGDEFWPQMRRRVDEYGAASIDIGGPAYHPICLAFRTDLWKSGTWSMREDWVRGWDVAGQLTHVLGGLRTEALLPRTRGVGEPIRSDRPGKVHFPAEVYAEAFSNTLGASRATLGPDAFGAEEGSLEDLVAHHRRWRSWADELVAGRATVDDFPAA